MSEWDEFKAPSVADKAYSWMATQLAKLFKAGDLGMPDALGDAGEELGQNGAGIAAGTVNGMLADPAKQLAGALGASAERTGQHIAEGERHVAAGITVGNRKHIDFVQQVALRDDPPRTGYQSPPEHRGADDRGVMLQRNCVHSLLWTSGPG
jgi:hypothetical protein